MADTCSSVSASFSNALTPSMKFLGSTRSITHELTLSGQCDEQLLPCMWGSSKVYARDRQSSLKVSRVKIPVSTIRPGNYFKATATKLNISTTILEAKVAILYQI
jgi:hypothetical protein